MSDERLIHNFKEAVRAESVTGHEGPMADFITSVALENGLQPIEQEGNILIHIPGRDRSRAFILNGHMDVVGVDNPGNWTHPPFSAEQVGNVVYGRGTVDMKSGLIAGLEATLRLAHRGSIPYDLFLTAVTREETDGYGTRAFARMFEQQLRSGYSEVSAILAEPTLLSHIHHSSLGNAAYHAVILGEAGHSARPDEVIHAPYAAAELMLAIRDFHLSLRERYADSQFGLPSVTATAVEARSDATNKIAGSAIVNIDLRTIAGMHDQAITAVEAIMRRWGAKWSPAFTPNFDPASTSKDAKIIKAIQSVAGSLPVTPFQASSDMGPLSKLGIDTVIFGPGDLEKAHRIDESIDLEQLIRSAAYFEQIYDKWAEM